MKVEKIEEYEKRLKICYTNKDGEDDTTDFRVLYDKESCKWFTNLSGSFIDEEIDAIRNSLKELNSKKIIPFLIEPKKEKI